MLAIVGVASVPRAGYCGVVSVPRAGYRGVASVSSNWTSPSQDRKTSSSPGSTACHLLILLMSLNIFILSLNICILSMLNSF